MKSLLVLGRGGKDFKKVFYVTLTIREHLEAIPLLFGVSDLLLATRVSRHGDKQADQSFT